MAISIVATPNCNGFRIGYSQRVEDWPYASQLILFTFNNLMIHS